GNVYSIKSYLFKTLYRDLVRMIKEKNKVLFKSVEYHELDFQVEVSHETKLINEEVNQERKKLLEEAINQLPSRQRRALLLFYREELSYKELCELMDFKDVRSARKLIYRAIASLKEKINL
ncbi:RNA polymerase sigma factor, partial [Echinicola sediminis]